MVQCFSLITNQPTVFLAMTFQPSDSSFKPNYKNFVIFFKEKKIKLHAGGFVRLPPS
jgi:hypothetical protein